MKTETYTLSDTLITTLAKLIQVAILTGTDVYDHLRTIHCIVQEGQIHTSPEFEERLNEEIDAMLSRAEVLSSFSSRSSSYITTKHSYLLYCMR